MHPELMRIVVEGIQEGEINTDSSLLIYTFAIFGAIAILHSVYFCKFVKYISNLKN